MRAPRGAPIPRGDLQRRLDARGPRSAQRLCRGDRFLALQEMRDAAPQPRRERRGPGHGQQLAILQLDAQRTLLEEPGRQHFQLVLGRGEDHRPAHASPGGTAPSGATNATTSARGSSTRCAAASTSVAPTAEMRSA